MLLSPVEIIKIAWKIYAENFKIFARVTAWGLFPAAALSLLALGNKIFGIAFYNYSLLLYIAFSALSAIILIWIQLVLIRLVNGGVTNKIINVKEIKSLAWHDIVNYFWVSVLVSVVVAFGFLIFIIPGVIFGIWFAFATTIFAVYNVKGRAALVQSKALVTGRWRQVFWRLVIPYGLYVAIIASATLLIELAFGAPNGFKEFQTYSGPWWISLAEALPSLIFLPLGPAILVTLLHNLEACKNETSVTPTPNKS